MLIVTGKVQNKPNSNLIQAKTKKSSVKKATKWKCTGAYNGVSRHFVTLSKNYLPPLHVTLATNVSYLSKYDVNGIFFGTALLSSL